MGIIYSICISLLGSYEGILHIHFANKQDLHVHTLNRLTLG
jgi:hypothetical protein